mmetsp:Transcript_114429/g.180166  ORF Transcript_114429/g.180166 Transcript_114429/m.180166 type:complete len:153 (+) Transcript_114429:57-515(+)
MVSFRLVLTLALHSVLKGLAEDAEYFKVSEDTLAHLNISNSTNVTLDRLPCCPKSWDSRWGLGPVCRSCQIFRIPRPSADDIAVTLHGMHLLLELDLKRAWTTLVQWTASHQKMVCVVGILAFFPSAFKLSSLKRPSHTASHRPLLQSEAEV